ncbi:MAG: hypothetical protein KDD83_21790 [Caldilineaceae bacterium]|nr:hypothetical protein [Caldilineaceae bacterium]
MTTKPSAAETSLAAVVAAHPYPDYAAWWPMGADFLAMMADAIVGEWRSVLADHADPAVPGAYVDEYIRTVYARAPRAGLVDDFVAAANLDAIRSGEFDALSYGFFHAAFEALAQQVDAGALPGARRAFTQRVGRRFFAQLADHLALDLPASLHSDADVARLRAAIDTVGAFLVAQGYLRDHFAFTFDVDVAHAGRVIRQDEGNLIAGLRRDGLAFALYEMGYPAILPSAVYLFHTLGEAQHHSSRTIEELFARAGCRATETDDFDPTGYPSDMVVELWEIRPADAA